MLFSVSKWRKLEVAWNASLFNSLTERNGAGKGREGELEGFYQKLPTCYLGSTELFSLYALLLLDLFGSILEVYHYIAS